MRIAQHIPATPDELTNWDTTYSGPPTPAPDHPGPITPTVQLVDLWLNRIPSVTLPQSGTQVPVVPRRYFIAKELHAATGFVSAALLEDMMGPAQSSPAWPEQSYGNWGQGWPHRSSPNDPC